MDKKLQKGHRERLRKKFLKAGLKGLHDYEAIELLLTFAIPRRDVKPVAKKLLAEYRNIAGILDAPVEKLRETYGLGDNSIVLLMLIRETCAEYLADRMKGRDALSNPESVRNFARMKLSGMKTESFMIIYLNTKNHVNEYEVINEGTVDQAIIYPRNIIKRALANDSTGLILIHNHPSGICEPSMDDRKLTSAIREAAKTINIRLIDHIIVGKSGYFSFSEKGLL